MFPCTPSTRWVHWIVSPWSRLTILRFHTASMENIPQEIIDDLAFDFASLNSASLVGKSWTHQSRRRLFHYVPFYSLNRWSGGRPPFPLTQTGSRRTLTLYSAPMTLQGRGSNQQISTGSSTTFVRSPESSVSRDFRIRDGKNWHHFDRPLFWTLCGYRSIPGVGDSGWDSIFVVFVHLRVSTRGQPCNQVPLPRRW